MRPWEPLLEKAVEFLENAGIGEEEWTFGGGSALAFRLGHRKSKDVDIFLSDAQLLLLLTPRLNDVVASAVKDYEEAATFLKLFLPREEIDFIVAPLLTRDSFTEEVVFGKKIRVETPVEIVTKKLFYWPEKLKVRDVVDIAATYREMPEHLLRECSHLLVSRLPVLEKRWAKLEKVYWEEVAKLDIIDRGVEHQAPGLFATFLEQVREYKETRERVNISEYIPYRKSKPRPPKL